MDGSYTQVIQCSKKVTPSVVVTARGVSSPPVSPPSAAPELSAHIGYSIIHTDLPGLTNNGFSGILDVGYRVNKYVSAELLVGLHYFPQEDPDDTFTWINTSINAKVSYPIGMFKVFANGGGGIYFQESDNRIPGWNLGGGLALDFHPNWGAELGYNYHTIMDDDNIAFSTIQLGIRYRF
jgi:hypothetical protein